MDQLHKPPKDVIIIFPVADVEPLEDLLIVLPLVI